MIPKGITTAYFKHLAKSSVFIELLKQCVTGIREGQNIDYSKLKGIWIPVPPVKEQLKIATYLDSIEARIKEISLLKKNKEAISSDIVTGKIDVCGIKIPEYEFAGENVEQNFEDSTEKELCLPATEEAHIHRQKILMVACSENRHPCHQFNRQNICMSKWCRYFNLW